MTKYKASLNDQKISLKDTLVTEAYRLEPIRNSNPLGTMLAVILFITLCFIMVLIGRQCSREPMPAVVKQACVKCHNKQMVLSQYFKRNGSKTPEEMAYAVLKTKSPRLLASMAVVESGGNHTIRKTGYKKRHYGAFQVNPKYWGAVPTDAVGQALQAEAIMVELTDKMPIKKALSVYGGDSGSGYQKKVLAELTLVP